MTEQYNHSNAGQKPLGADEPIAVVGLACRFPGADDVNAFWKLLETGQSAVTEGVPGSGVGRVGELFDRTSVQAEACRFGAYLDGLEMFDAEFFRISPVEAQLLDPQQRLMLETSWQALEDAGIDPEGLKGSRTGVYAGISNNEYRGLILASSETDEPAASLYSVTGTSFNTAIGRVAFVLGFHGPAIALDTACSSSLVAVHQAVVGLQREEADLALAGGVHTILSGRLLELRANAGMLSPEGRCNTFDASANGYVRGEGCGILVLKRLSEAEVDGDRIWGVIRGVALNQDGASVGLTVPNGEAQELVIADALTRAGVGPSGVDYVEAHGTGTPVGDPIEAQATGTVYSRGRDPESPLLIGSVKTNIGHLEAAAGAAGLMKVILAMRQGVIPKHLHFRNPNPEIDWESLALKVTSEATAWPSVEGRPPRAGVSGFGWSGTNAHVVVEGYGRAGESVSSRTDGAWPAGAFQRVGIPGSAVDARLREGATERRMTRLLPLSGKTEEALREMASRYLGWIDAADDPDVERLLADMAWTASVGRAHFTHRAGVTFEDVASLRSALKGTAEGEGRAEGLASKVAFVFTGQASQWVGMGEELYRTEPVFRAVLDRCDEVLRQDRGVSLLDVMFGRPGTQEDLDDPAWTQPAIYSLESALTALWASVGVHPSAVVGHSLGEIAAAHAAGVFTLEQGLRFAAARGELFGSVPGEGAMAAIFASQAQVASVVAEQNTTSQGVGVSVAVDNGAHQVISGPAADVDALVERFEASEIRVRRLRRSPAYHSAMVEPALDQLEEAVRGIAGTPPAPSIDLVSNVTGRVIQPEQPMDGSYWRRHGREPVAFRSCVETLAELGVDLVVEVGPFGVLGPIVSLAWPEPVPGAGPSTEPVVLSSLRRPPRDANDPETDGSGGFVSAVAAAYEAGLDVSFPGLFAGEERRRISIPGYPFQRRRHWVDAPRRRRTSAGHPLLGSRHESPRGEVMFETEMIPSDPGWLDDHRVFGRVLGPGALYGAMAAALGDSNGAVVVEELQMQNPLVFQESENDEGTVETGRKVQVVLEAAVGTAARKFEIFSKGEGEDKWTLHADGRVSSGISGNDYFAARTLESLREGLPPRDIPEYYRTKAGTGIELGPSFRSLMRLWSEAGEAVAEVALPEDVERGGLGLHPVLLDGCFQVMSQARYMAGSELAATYIPFAWERLWLAGPLPDRIVCHAVMRESNTRAEPDVVPEVLTGDLWFYGLDGSALGGLTGFTVKRTTRASLFSATEALNDLFYEVVWKDRPLPPGMLPAEFLASPTAVVSSGDAFSQYLAAEGVESLDRADLQTDLERLSWSFALENLEKMGWERRVGERVEAEALRQNLGVLDEHQRLFRRMLELLVRGGVLEAADGEFVVRVGPQDPLPEEMTKDTQGFADRMEEQYSHGVTEVRLFRRSAGALADVILGEADALTLLFSSGEPSAADLYRLAPVARAANRMLGDAVAGLLGDMPEGRKLRVLEVGAGTGSATASVLPELPVGQYEYVYTDISAGFFAEAEERFGGAEAGIDYRVLDIEKDPVAQGFEPHGYDLIFASNVLHATRYLQETLANCSEVLAPSGILMALENLRGQGWLDLTFGQLDGWWRFADDYRPDHALASPAVWKQVLGDVGFEDSQVLGLGPDSQETPDRGVIMARGPAEVLESPGMWVVASDTTGVGEELAAGLAALNQTVVVAGHHLEIGTGSIVREAQVYRVAVDMYSRESWRSVFEGLPKDVPLKGVVHLAALDGHGAGASSSEFAGDVRHAASSAIGLVQGMTDTDVTPGNGVWFITRGGQVLERERPGELAGATLWGLGKVVAREAPQLQPRMIDLEPGTAPPFQDLCNELLHPDGESHIAYRLRYRQAARLERAGAVTERLTLPEDSGWTIEPDPDGVLELLRVEPLPERALEAKEVRVAVEAAGLNFWDVFRALGLIEEGVLGGEVCGRVIEVGAEVSTVSVGDQVVALAFGTFRSEMITREEMVAPAPSGVSLTDLATIPTVFVSAALSFEWAKLKAGERVLIHAGAGGVGLAAIQLAHAAGAEVFATASASKQAYLRSLGVKHVFDSRSTRFGQDILEATGGEGVHVVLNSLTGEGFIDASLACLAHGGRFVELARVDIFTEEEMAAARPDVAYYILMLDVLKEVAPAEPGDALRRVMKQLSAGEVAPLVHTRWSMAEAGPAMKFMRAARHTGKIVLTASPLETGRLREDRSYLVTGGLGGIGCVVAEWLADRGAGAIVLNGRREPDAAAEEAIAALRARGVNVRVELADVTDADAVHGMMERIDATLPPLAGVIHSVGVLSDAALTNQNWERFEQVLGPKVQGAWHLHQETLHRDLDMFVLFSSVAGVLGNPGQANHSAANAFLDQLAGYRRSLGLAGQSIAWGAWAGLGEAEEQRERIARQLEAAGTGWMTPAQGIQALDRLVRQDVTSGMVAVVDWPVLTEGLGEETALLEDLLADAEDGSGGSGAGTVDADLLTRLRTTAASERESLLASFVQAEVKTVLRLPSTPAPTVGFFEMGMDSLMSVELRNRLNRALSGEYVVSNTAVFDYPNVASLAQHLTEELGRLGDAGAPSAPLARPVRGRRRQVSQEEDSIAIVGMACRFPGAPDLPAFWRLLEEGETTVTDGRQDGGNWKGLVGDPKEEEAVYRRGGFVEGIDQFDARFFRIAPIEARMMDPQQRMLLETTWQALEDAGIDPEGLRGSRTGVYAGVGGSEYRDVIAANGQEDAFLGTAASVTAGRIAFAFGLEGPAMPVDMACASSLAAVHQASVALMRGEVDLALASGVNVTLSQSFARFYRELGMISKTGHCNAFDTAADGFVRSEGCGVVVLKRLSEAEADGDRIWGVIKGSAINQNGASAGLPVPNGPAQERVIEDALARAGVEACEVDYLEAHGTGTALGDSIELRALAAVYGRGREPEHPLLLGSCKTNLGHLEWAAGMASLMKTVMAMRKRVIPRHLHFRDPNPNFDWETLPLQVSSSPMNWPSNGERAPLAGINSFGLSGTNAHLIVEGYGAPAIDGVDQEATKPVGIAQAVPVAIPEEFPTATAPDVELEPRRTRLLALSGKSDDALRDLAQSYVTWLEQVVSDADGAAPILPDMAWTAGVGRSHFPCRAGITFQNASQLKERLLALARREKTSEEWQPRQRSKVAFVYGGTDSQWTGMGEALYRSEPVVRAVLNRFEDAFLAEHDASLLEVIFGRVERGEWRPAATYAMECALTAFWKSIGIRPSVVLGRGLGELAASQAAGVVSMEDGLRMAAASGGAPVSEAMFESPSVPILSSATGKVVDSVNEFADWHWGTKPSTTDDFIACGRTLAGLGVDVLVLVGPDPTLAEAIKSSWMPHAEGAETAEVPVVLGAFQLAGADGASGDSSTEFVEMAAKAYEAGLDVAFSGLFAGEMRSRISVPSYPFQRRSFWVEPVKGRA